MPTSRLMLVLPFFVLCAAWAVGQEQTASGVLDLGVRPKIDNKQVKLSRKRFYLLRGGLQDNKALLDRIRSSETVSQDCFYAKANASPELVCWLRTENCESPYCRRIETADIDRVPEFKAAYDKGLAQFSRKPDIARLWLTTNLSPLIMDGFYRERQTSLKKILGDVIPIQSKMSDGAGVKAVFTDLPVGSGKKSEKFTVSNILPIEIGGKGYVWTCEVDVSTEKRGTLRLPDVGKTVKNCAETVVKDLAVCNAGACTQK